VEPLTTRGRGCYICETVQEPSGLVLTKIWALKARLKPIIGQVQLQVKKKAGATVKTVRDSDSART